MEEILRNNNMFLEKLELQSTIIQEAVKKAIQENDVASGTVTMPILTEQLDNHHKSIIEFIKANCSKLSDDCRIVNGIDGSVGGESEAGELLFVDDFQKGTEKNPMYCYNGHFWDVPKNFRISEKPDKKSWMGVLDKRKTEQRNVSQQYYKKSTSKTFPKI